MNHFSGGFPAQTTIWGLYNISIYVRKSGATNKHKQLPNFCKDIDHPRLWSYLDNLNLDTPNSNQNLTTLRHFGRMPETFTFQQKWRLRWMLEIHHRSPLTKVFLIPKFWGKKTLRTMLMETLSSLNVPYSKVFPWHHITIVKVMASFLFFLNRCKFSSLDTQNSVASIHRPCCLTPTGTSGVVKTLRAPSDPPSGAQPGDFLSRLKRLIEILRNETTTSWLMHVYIDMYIIIWTWMELWRIRGWVSWLNMILGYTGYTWNLWMSSIYADSFVLQNHRLQHGFGSTHLCNRIFTNQLCFFFRASCCQERHGGNKDDWTWRTIIKYIYI